MLQNRPHQVAKNRNRLERRLNAALKANVTPARKKNHDEPVTGDGLKQANNCPQCSKSTHHFLTPPIEATQKFDTFKSNLLSELIRLSACRSLLVTAAVQAKTENFQPGLQNP